MRQPLFFLFNLEAPVTDTGLRLFFLRLFIVIIVLFVIIDPGIVYFIITNVGLNVSTSSAAVVIILVTTTIFVILPI